jgi:glc operon protein GlcG
MVHETFRPAALRMVVPRNFSRIYNFFSVRIGSAAETMPRMQGGIPMSLRVMTAVVLAGGLLAIGVARAQQPPLPPNLDAIPDKMPFDIPYGPPITLEKAQALVQAGIAEATKRGWHYDIAVVDSGANLVTFSRMSDGPLGSIAIAEHKARAAAKYRRPTKIFEDLVQKANFRYLLSLDDVVASRGGIPLVENGKIVGAIGCSAGTGSQDELICEAAIKAVMK